MEHSCPICGNPFDSYEGMRLSSVGVYWCGECQTEFDSIDWEEVYNDGEWSIG